jgi:hypothetical protein
MSAPSAETSTGPEAETGAGGESSLVERTAAPSRVTGTATRRYTATAAASISAIPAKMITSWRLRSRTAAESAACSSSPAENVQPTPGTGASAYRRRVPSRSGRSAAPDALLRALSLIDEPIEPRGSIERAITVRRSRVVTTSSTGRPPPYRRASPGPAGSSARNAATTPPRIGLVTSAA